MPSPAPTWEKTTCPTRCRPAGTPTADPAVLAEIRLLLARTRLAAAAGIDHTLR